MHFSHAPLFLREVTMHEYLVCIDIKRLPDSTPTRRMLTIAAKDDNEAKVLALELLLKDHIQFKVSRLEPVMDANDLTIKGDK